MKYNVVVVGGGPAGLGAAIEAKRNGAKDVLIIERDRELGGILNQCIHNGFGLHEFKEEVTNKVSIVKIDVDQNPELASEYGVQSIPTLIMFKNGELKEKMVGLTSKATLSEKLIKLL